MEDKVMDIVEMLWAEAKKLRAELDEDPRWKRLEMIQELIATYESKPRKDLWPHSKWHKESEMVKDYLDSYPGLWQPIGDIAAWLDLSGVGGQAWSINDDSRKQLTSILSASKMFEAKRGEGWRNKE